MIVRSTIEMESPVAENHVYRSREVGDSNLRQRSNHILSVEPARKKRFNTNHTDRMSILLSFCARALTTLCHIIRLAPTPLESFTLITCVRHSVIHDDCPPPPRHFVFLLLFLYCYILFLYLLSRLMTPAIQGLRMNALGTR